MKKKIKIIGIGKFFQTIHLKYLKRQFKIIECYDPRIDLLRLFSKKNKIKKNYTNLEKFSADTNRSITFCCSSRESSFHILKKLIPKNKFIFSEKPLVFNLKDAKALSNLSKKNNTYVKVGFMTRYDKSILYLKKFLKEKNLLNTLKNVEFELSNNKLYINKLSYIRTNENNDFLFSKIRYPNWLKKKYYIKYHIFINRYAHILNLSNFFFKKIIPTDFIIKDKYNFDVKAKSNKTKIKVVCTNKKSYLIKIVLNFLNGDQIECILKNPTIPYISYIKFKSRKSIKKVNFKNNLFKYQAEKLIKKNDQSSTNLEDLIRDISLIEEIWKTKN